MKSIFIFLTPIVLLTLFSCSHNPLSYRQELKDYKKNARELTRTQKSYKGIQNKFETSITFLNKELQGQRLMIESKIQMQSPETLQENNFELTDSAQREALFFVSHYSPQTMGPKLKDSNLWTFKLFVDNTSVTGTVKSAEKKSNLIHYWYPHHTVWSEAWILSFPINANHLSEKTFKIIASHPDTKLVFEY